MNTNLTLYTGPAGAGKTQLLCERVAEVAQAQPLARVVIIVPSAFLAGEFRHRLLKESVRSLLGVEIVTLPDLCRSILGSAGLPYLEIGDIVQHQLVGTVVENLLADDDLRYYAPIALKPGFINVVRDFIAELKHGLIRPSKFAAVAGTRGNKDKDLAAICGAYHQLLQDKRLADQEGIMWLARDELAGDPQLGAPIDLLVIDDLEEPSPLQVELVALLSARARVTAITLTYEEGRSLLDRGKRSFVALAEALQPDVMPVPAGVVDPHSPLGYLERHLFELQPVDQIDGRKAVTVLEAPERHREVKEVAREVKRLLLQGVPPAEITVLFRSLEPYSSVIYQVFEEFGIPILVRGGYSLSENPLVAFLLRLLTLASDDLPRRGVIATLRSPYFDFASFGFGAREVSALDRISRERMVTSGRSMWREALELEAEKPTVTEENGGPAPGPDQGVDPLQVLKNLDALFDAVAPAPEGTCEEYAAFVEELIGDDPRRPAGPETGPGEQESSGLRIVERVLAGPLELAVRDLSALQEVKGGLRSMTQTAGLTGNGTGSWSQFLSDFRNVLNASRYTLRQSPVRGIKKESLVRPSFCVVRPAWEDRNGRSTRP